MPTRRTATRIGLACLILAGAVAVRVTALARSEGIAGDGAIYLGMAREMGSSGLVETIHSYAYHPGYSMSVAAMARATGAQWPEGWVTAGQAVSLIAGGVMLVCLWVFARRTFGERAAWGTLFVYALSEPLIVLHCEVASDSLAGALSMLSAVGILAAVDRTRAGKLSAGLPALLGGLAGGAAYLARPEALVIPLAGGMVLLFARRDAKAGRITKVLALAALLGGVATLVLPYALTIGGLTNKKSLQDIVSLSSPGWPLATGGWLNSLDALRRALDRGRAAIGYVALFLAATTAITWLTHAIRPHGLPRSVVRKPSRVEAAMIAIVTAVMLAVVTSLEIQSGPGYVSSRHMLLPALFLAPLSGAGLITLIHWLRFLTRRGGRPIGFRRAAMVMVALALVAMSFNAFPCMHEGKRAYLHAGRYIRRTLGPDRRILASDFRAMLFAGADPSLFRQTVDRETHLLPHMLRSPHRVYHVMTNVLDRDILIVNQKTMEAVAFADILSKLARDPRFEYLGQFDGLAPQPDLSPPPKTVPRCGRRHCVWVFRIRRNIEPGPEND